MKQIRLLALPIAICLNLAAMSFAAETNSPPENKSVPETGPLAALAAGVLHQGGVFPLDTKMALALGLISVDGLNRAIMVPEAEADGGNTWIEVARTKGRTYLILGHSEISANGVGLTVYLTSPSGVLEKAARRINGGEFSVVPLNDAATGFNNQVTFWQAWLAQSARP